MDGMIALAYANRLYNLAEGPQGPQGEPGGGAVGTVADAYSSSKTYAVGDYAIHNEELYICISAITTAEAFTAAHWTQVVLGDDVTDLKSDISNIYETEDASLTWEDGKYINPNGTVKDLETASCSVYNALDDYTDLSVNFSYNNQYIASICFYEQTAVDTYSKVGDAVTNVTSGNKIAVPSGATHFGVTRLTSEKSSVVVTLLKSKIDEIADDVDEIDGKISEFVKDTEAVLTWTSGKYINPNGSLGNLETYSLSNPIDVYGAESITFNMTKASTQYIAPLGFYKGDPLVQNYIDGNKISTSSIEKGVPISVPKEANYAVVGIPTADTSILSVSVKKSDVLKDAEFLINKNRVGVCFGDSITNGVGVLPASGAVPTCDVVSDMKRITVRRYITQE